MLPDFNQIWDFGKFSMMFPVSRERFYDELMSPETKGRISSGKVPKNFAPILTRFGILASFS